MRTLDASAGLGADVPRLAATAPVVAPRAVVLVSALEVVFTVRAQPRPRHAAPPPAPQLHAEGAGRGAVTRARAQLALAAGQRGLALALVPDT